MLFDRALPVIAIKFRISFVKFHFHTYSKNFSAISGRHYQLYLSWVFMGLIWQVSTSKLGKKNCDIDLEIIIRFCVHLF